MFPLLSPCFFFKIFLSPKPLYFSTLKKTYVRLFFPQTISSSLSLFVSIFRSFLSFFSLFPLKKISFFFRFGSPLVFIGGRGRGSPCPAQAQGKVAGAWLAFLFHYGDRVKGIWVVLGGWESGKKLKNLLLPYLCTCRGRRRCTLPFKTTSFRAFFFFKKMNLGSNPKWLWHHKQRLIPSSIFLAKYQH